MHLNWINTLPGSLAVSTFVAWPASRCGSPSLGGRIKFCLLSMLGVAALAFGIRPHPQILHGTLGVARAAGSVTDIMAMAFLVFLWSEKITEMLTDMLFGFIESSDDRPLVLAEDTEQIEKAARLYREGRHRRALRLCHQIIESNSCYAATAATFVYWIENPRTVKIHKPPRIAVRLKKRLSSLNFFWTL